MKKIFFVLMLIAVLSPSCATSSSAEKANIACSTARAALDFLCPVLQEVLTNKTTIVSPE